MAGMRALNILLLAILVGLTAAETGRQHDLSIANKGRNILSQQWEEDRSLLDSNEPWVEPLSWTPRAFLFHNFMTHAEADHIVATAKPFMKRSTVVGQNGDSVEDSIRTSYGTFISRLRDPTISKIQQRVAGWTKLNISHQEDMQVLRYAHGQKYGAHYDSLEDDSPRVATVLLYLADVDEGGETAFPQNSKWIDESVGQRMQPMSECARGHVAARPRKGDALLFYSIAPDGTHDDAAMHTGCPVIKGVKWTSTIWIHTKPFRPNTLGQQLQEERVRVLPEDCVDSDPLCVSWAADGECENNAGFMRGDSFSLGACRKSCKECVECDKDDRECRSANRVKAGYLSLDELDREVDSSFSVE